MTKYHAKRTQTPDGIWHDSKKEANRWMELLYLEKAGSISHLRRQVPFELIPKQEGERAVIYRADFVYWNNITNEMVVEDCKGVRTDVYKLKRKLCKWILGITIYET